MLCLALDASTPRVAAALVRDGVPLASASLPAPPRRSGMLFDVVQSLLDETALAFRDLASIAVGLGPGSYTGLRVSLVAARGWALPLRIPVLAYPSPASLAASVFAAHPDADSTAFVGHARRGFRWTARFRRAAPDAPLPAPDPDFSVVPDSSPLDFAPSLPPDTPPDPVWLARLAFWNAPSFPLVPLYLNAAVNTPPRFAPDGSPLAPSAS